ncbi:Protein phosphatase 2C family [Phytophthora cactorum]|nr:Protein phosphatase 2C family [Phytophthora cactorum]
MGCTASKPSSPPPGSDDVSTESKPVDKSSDDETDQSKPPSDALLRLAMEAKDVEKPSDTRGERLGSGSIDASPLKSLMLLGDQLPVASSMLPDVTYSMRDSPSQVASQNLDGLDQPVNVGSIRKSTGVQNVQTPPRLGSNVGGVQMPAIPLQQPQVARAPGWAEGVRFQLDIDLFKVLAPQYLADRFQLREEGTPSTQASKVESSSSDEDSDEDIEKEDEEVEDWDLDDDASAVALTPTAKSPRINSPTRVKDEGVSQTQQAQTSRLNDETQQQESEQGAAPPASPPRRRSSGFQPKFRPTLDLSDDFENVVSDSNDSSDDSDEDADESDDVCVHDWLDGPVDPSPTPSPVRRVVSPTKPIAPLISAREAPQASPTAQSHPNSRHAYGLTIATGSPTHMTSGPSTPLPPGRTPQPPTYRQGNMSPTRSAGANMHIAMIGSTSPVKQSSYRSGIINNLAPASPSKSAPSPSSSPAAAAIRDTKVVKKKKAELPQHNLPHPVPKFGDWLNSRTMINNYIILEPLGVGGYAEKDVVKIADFGISQSLYGSKQKIADVAGTPAFMSPEMCTGEEYSGQLADVWALGATIFMLKFGNPPFLAKSAMQMFERIQNDPLVFPAAIDPLLAHLLSGMLTKSPQKRLTLLDVMVHPWVTKNEKHTLAINRPSRAITVSKDEIEHAVGANHIAIVVNIRKQMRKRLKRARESLEAKKKSTTTTTDWVNSNLVFAQSPKSINARTSEERNVLSSEEIDYRSLLFSRKKASNKNTLEAVPPSGDPTNKGAVAHAHHSMNDCLDDEDVFSDDDDELAVSQSPQLLDELLLTTLSMPPLANRNGMSGNTSKLSAASIGNRALYSSIGRHDDLRFYGESPALAVRYGVSSLQGRRNTQEDRWVVFPLIAATLDNCSWTTDTAYVGIYDGHGGEECANILHEQLHTWIFKSPESSLSVKDLQDCFESLDASVCDYLLHKDDLSGSTATGLILRPAVNGNILLTIAHVGDCRLVLGKRDGNTVELTQDHRLTLEAERERVIQLGGRVVNNRVNGVMAITRAFGDLEFKGMLNLHQGNSGSSGFGRAFRDTGTEKVPPLLTAKPDVHELELNSRDDAFLLLACDGLWDVLTSEEATAIFRDRVELHGDLQLAAHELAQEGIHELETSEPRGSVAGALEDLHSVAVNPAIATSKTNSILDRAIVQTPIKGCEACVIPEQNEFSFGFGFVAGAEDADLN